MFLEIGMVLLGIGIIILLVPLMYLIVEKEEEADKALDNYFKVVDKAKKANDDINEEERIKIHSRFA